MRLSANENDPAFDYRCLGAKVFLDGVEITNCVTADEEAGECICFALDGAGGLMVGHDDEVLTEVKRGVVKIVLPS